MRRLDSLIVAAGDASSVPAGEALAVDRELFAACITGKLESHPNITIERAEVTTIDESRVHIIATGPLTSDALAAEVGRLTGQSQLFFYDAVAPTIDASTINREIAFPASRYDKGDAAYLNCPFTKDEYQAFYDALLAGRTGAPARARSQSPLLRRLPADRSPGRARPQNAVLRPDEAGRPDRPAHGPPALGLLAASAGEPSGNALLDGRLPDAHEVGRPEARLPADPRPGERRVRPLRRHPPQHLHPVAAGAGRHAPDAGLPERLLRRPDHRRRGLRRVRRHGHPGGPQRRPASARPAAADAAGHDDAGRADELCRPLRRQRLPADELQLGHRAAAAGPHPGQKGKERLLAERALAALADALPA